MPNRRRNRRRTKNRLGRLGSRSMIVGILIVILLAYLAFSYTATEDRITVTLARHIDGDTTEFYINGTRTTVRYLAIDADEIRGDNATELGHQASEHVRYRLENATVIELEFDPSRDRLDRFGRTLAWVWVDGVLLQEELVQMGLARVAFTQGNELYLYRLK